MPKELQENRQHFNLLIPNSCLSEQVWHGLCLYGGMDNSIYIALSHQLMMFRDLEVTSNNIANVNTPGYSAEKLSFREHLVRDINGQNSFANDPTSYRDTSHGSFKTTNNPFDLAINGNAYFQVQTPLGVRYSKAGAFQINDQGTMVNPDGYAVLGSDGGEITIPATARSVIINGVGQVSVDGEDAGQVGLMEFTNEQALKRLGNSLYSSTETPQPSETARVVQGAVEMSNVAGVTELTRVIQLQRSVSSSAKFIETMYDLQRKASQTFTRSGQA
jgi:flagellar basal-body rod protein FlgF